MNTLKLALLGATGPSGQQFVTQALAKGHDLVTLVRNPSKMKIQHDRLKVVVASIFDADALAKHFQGCDVVISCLGVDNSLSMLYKDVTFYSESARAITTAMTQTNVKRFIFISSWGVESISEFPWKIRLPLKLYGRLLADMRRMEKSLEEECPEIEYTSVRPCVLTDKSATDLEVKKEAGVNFSRNMKMEIPRADVARAMLEIMEGNLFVRQCVAVGHPK